MGQPFVVENRASASGNVGAEAVFHAAPDGYTLLSSSGSPLAINGWIYKKLNYDPAGFEPVAIMSRIPNVLVVRNDFPAANRVDRCAGLYIGQQAGFYADDAGHRQNGIDNSRPHETGEAGHSRRTYGRRIAAVGLSPATKISPQRKCGRRLSLPCA